MPEAIAPQPQPNQQELGDNPMPEDLNQFSHLDAQVASDGSRRIYGVDSETGKKIQVKGDDVLNAYGYGEADLPGNQPPQEGVVDIDNETPTEETESPAAEEKDLYDEYSDQVKDESATMRVKNPETGKMDVVKAKDLTFREWIKAKEQRKAASWYTRTRSHAEAPDEIDPDKGPTKEEIDALGNKDHQERLNEQSGEKNPTEDDIEYYRKLKDMGQEKEEETPEKPEPPESPEKPKTSETITSPELQEAEKKLDTARSEYAKIKAGHESSTFFSRKFSKKKLEAAETAYMEAKAEAGAIGMELLKEAGLSQEDRVSSNNWAAMLEKVTLIREQFDIERENIDGKRLKPFYDWWHKQGTKLFSMGTVKKGAVMAAIGVPVGVATAIVSAPIIGGAGVAAGAATLLSKNISRGIVGNRIRQNAGGEDGAVEKARARHEVAQKITDMLEAKGQLVTSEIDEETSEEAPEARKGNNSRAVKSAGVAVLGMVAGAFVADRVGDFVNGGPDAPEPPAPENPSEWDAMAARQAGIVDSRPGAAEDWQNFLENAPQTNAGTPSIDALDPSNFTYEAAGLNESQQLALQETFGRFSAEEQFGNEWITQHTNELVDLVKDGNDPEDIVKMYTV